MGWGSAVRRAALGLALAACLPAVALGATQVVLLGTGNPQPDPDRSGPATAVVVEGSAYLVDFGPGVVRRAAQVARDGKIAALEPARITRAFVTHLHSDHTAGYADLILTPWPMGRETPLHVYGPKGLRAMTEHLLEAYREDIRIRSGGMEGLPAEGVRVEVHEVGPGLVHEDPLVRVTAFPTRHGEWAESFGYRFDTPGRSVVIAGDTAPSEEVIKACAGCDVLVHEALTMKYLANPRRRLSGGRDFRDYAAAYHTTTEQLAEIATRARPGLLVLHHNPISLRPDVRPLASTPEDLLREVQSRYGGRVVVGRDLDVY